MLEVTFSLLEKSVTNAERRNFIFCNVYLFERERERDRVRMGEGQRERETQNPKQAPGSELSAQSPTWGSDPQTARS